MLVRSSVLAFLSPPASWDALLSATGDELLSSPLVGPFCPTEINEYYRFGEKTYFLLKLLGVKCPITEHKILRG